MRVRIGKSSGVRAEVLLRVRGLEERCELLEREMNSMALTERLRQAVMRIAELETRLRQQQAA